ncbi:MAG: glucose-6-phosphate isomerase family protein [Christensenellales bacterium]|jgi:glucose-6-phosphate isomerase
MMELKRSGLPVYLDEETNVLAISAALSYMGYARKTAGEMRGLFADEKDLQEDDPVYDVYRGLAFPEDEALLEAYDFQYDITIVMPGHVNGECKKTSGHYHGYNKTRTNTYAEVYEVIKGTALYVLQRADHFDSQPEDMDVRDIILATVRQGQTIIVPPNYGHCSVNIGEGPLVFSNLAYKPCPIHYDPVRHHQGMGVYVLCGEKGPSIQPNPRYKKLPESRRATVRENPKLGIIFGLPVYESFKKTPQAFAFLANPDIDRGAVMDMLCIE